MKKIYPAYYPLFRCSAGKCTDTCCKNWEIDIDNETLKKYNAYRGPLGKTFSQNIENGNDGAHFILKKDGRCPYLNADNLCDIYAEIGGAALCDICKEHPRFYNYLAGCEECGIGLCCEEAAKLILDEKYDNSLIEEADGSTPEDRRISEEEITFANYRQRVLLGNLEKYYRDCIEFPKPFDREMLVSFFDMLLGLEIISDSWRELLCGLKNNISEIIAGKDNFLEKHPEVKTHYKRLVHYLVYRHANLAFEGPGVPDGLEFVDALVLYSLTLICLADIYTEMKTGEFTFQDQVNICKLYSQEIEYDEDNVWAVIDF